MVRRVFSLVLALQLLLPSYAPQILLAALAPTPAPTADPVAKPAVKVCPCTGKAGCNCCGCDEEEPESKTAPAAHNTDTAKHDAGPHGCIRCPCKVAAALAAPSVYLPNHSPMLLMLCQPQQEWLPARAERWFSPSLPIDFPPPKTPA